MIIIWMTEVSASSLYCTHALICFKTYNSFSCSDPSLFNGVIQAMDLVPLYRLLLPVVSCRSGKSFFNVSALKVYNYKYQAKPNNSLVVRYCYIVLNSSVRIEGTRIDIIEFE